MMFGQLLRTVGVCDCDTTWYVSAGDRIQVLDANSSVILSGWMALNPPVAEVTMTPTPKQWAFMSSSNF
jgi:hypothetical protein